MLTKIKKFFRLLRLLFLMPFTPRTKFLKNSFTETVKATGEKITYYRFRERQTKGKLIRTSNGNLRRIGTQHPTYKNFYTLK